MKGLEDISTSVNEFHQFAVGRTSFGVLCGTLPMEGWKKRDRRSLGHQSASPQPICLLHAMPASTAMDDWLFLLAADGK